MWLIAILQLFLKPPLPLHFVLYHHVAYKRLMDELRIPSEVKLLTQRDSNHYEIANKRASFFNRKFHHQEILIHLMSVLSRFFLEL